MAGVMWCPSSLLMNGTPGYEELPNRHILANCLIKRKPEFEVFLAADKHSRLAQMGGMNNLAQ